MTNEERKDITNAIWLCATHADLIDRDEVTYAADALRAMKNEHEENIRVIQQNGILAGVSRMGALMPAATARRSCARHRPAGMLACFHDT
jgi:hypothetical protein